MAEADKQIIWTRDDWVKLSIYAGQKTAETESADIAHQLIVRELEMESQGRLLYHYKRADDVDGRVHDEGLPIGYRWGDAVFDWLRSIAHWSKRLRPGLGLLPELKIYGIEVLPAFKPAAEPKIVDTAPSLPAPDTKLSPAPKPEPELEQKVDLEQKVELEVEPTMPLRSKEWIMKTVGANQEMLREMKSRTAASVWLEAEMARAKKSKKCKRALDRRTIEGYLRKFNLL